MEDAEGMEAMKRWIAERVRRYRERRAVQVQARAKEIFDRIGPPPGWKRENKP